jgi:hypothetical protein
MYFIELESQYSDCLGDNMSDETQSARFLALRMLVDQQIRPQYRWYSTHTLWPRLCFRCAGILVVIGSLTLPVIAAQKGWPPRVLTGVSLMVAVISSLSTFFKWDSTWQSRISTSAALRSLLAKWELSMESAGTAEKPDDAALAATEKLFDDAFNIVGSETKQFFATVKWPDTRSKPDA